MRNLGHLHDWLRHSTMQAGEHKLLIQLDMEELFSGKTVTTFRYIKPKGDILTQLRQCIDNDIETLYKIIAQQEENTQYV